MSAVQSLVGPSIENVSLNPNALLAQLGKSQEKFIDKSGFKEAAKLDPVIVQALVLYDGIL